MYKKVCCVFYIALTLYYCCIKNYESNNKSEVVAAQIAIILRNYNIKYEYKLNTKVYGVMYSSDQVGKGFCLRVPKHLSTASFSCRYIMPWLRGSERPKYNLESCYIHRAFGYQGLFFFFFFYFIFFFSFHVYI